MGAILPLGIFDRQKRAEKGQNLEAKGIRICDAIMGSGKTEAAIKWMNDSPDETKFVFVTPYLSEVERIKSSCQRKDFKEPARKKQRKLFGLKDLLAAGENIATTHNLFGTLDADALQLVRKNHYHLVLDECIYETGLKMTGGIEFCEEDFDICLRAGLIDIDEDGEVKWVEKDYNGRMYSFMKSALSGDPMIYNEGYFYRKLSGEEYTSFESVTLLTYLFPFQMQRALFDIMGLDYSFIGVEKTSAGYVFTDEIVDPPYAAEIIDHIHIIDDERMNSIGEDENALCVSWYERKRKTNGLLKQIGNNIRWAATQEGAKCSDAMWTVFKESVDKIDTHGYKSGFVPCNARASNEYCDRWFVAYCVNIFLNPAVKRYFESRHCYLDSEGYALSEMVQWVWRSAVRSGRDIALYVPSSRMRRILKEWLENLKDGGHGREFAGRKKWKNQYNKGRSVPVRKSVTLDEGQVSEQSEV